MNRFLVLLTSLLLSCLWAHAEGPDEHYVRIYQMIQEADRLNDMGQARLAAARYVEAQGALANFRTLYPGWNERVVNYRLNYITTKLEPLNTMLGGTPSAPKPAMNAPPVTTPPPTAATPTNPAAPIPLIVTSIPGTSPTNPIPLFTPTNTAPAWSAEFDNQVQSLKAEIERLQADNKLLAARLKEALSVQPAGIDPKEMARAEDRIRALQKENELFRVQLAQRTNSSAPTPEMLAKLNEQNEMITTLRAENEILKKQSVEWQVKLDSATNMVREALAKAASEAARGTEELDRANAKNLALQKQIALLKEVEGNTQRRILTNTVMPAEAQRELAALKARVQVLEARPAPYTTEELALFARTPSVLTAAIATSTPQPAASAVPPPAEGSWHAATHGIPAGAQPLVVAAERAFARGNYLEAVQKYAEVLRQDTNNVTTLGNLASAQLELGEVNDSERNVQRALASDPGDYFSLYVLGRLRFRQDKLDEALDALSRSAKANPNFPDTQNYLGIVLSEKGLRVPAEAALRRAVQLQPDNAVAHNNLAVVYATQTPPAVALARWHYQKAIAAGHPKNEALEKIIGKP